MKLYTGKRLTLNHNNYHKKGSALIEGGYHKLMQKESICYKTSCAFFVITVKAYEKTEFRLTQKK